jgi:hypothetical protein
MRNLYKGEIWIFVESGYEKGCINWQRMTAEVYEWGQDHVLKIYYDWFHWNGLNMKWIWQKL